MSNILITDANILDDAGTDSMKGSKFKYATQKYEMCQLLETAELQRDLLNGRYKPDSGRKFLINERGKERFITSNTMRDKTVNHVICDYLVTPSIKPYLVYDNGASQKGKGVSFTRKRYEAHLHKAFNEYGTNDFYILFIDFSGYYANIHHNKCKDDMYSVVRPNVHPSETNLVFQILDSIFKSFETDVSFLSDNEVKNLYDIKVDPIPLQIVDPKLQTGQKKLKKGVDIGNQLSQDIGIYYPHKVDNLIKIVKGCRYFGRYTDDIYVMHNSKEFLLEVLDAIKGIAGEYGLIINMKKTRICKASQRHRFLQIFYTLTDTGWLMKNISPKSVTRERRKLKAYKRLLDSKRIDYPTVENSFKSWLGGNWKNMSHQQIYNLNSLYEELFGKKVTWKKGHSRLHWLMVHNCQTSDRMETAI